MNTLMPIATFEGGDVYFDALASLITENATFQLDDTSQISGLYSLKCATSAGGAVAVFRRSFNVPVDIFGFQFSIKLSSDFSLDEGDQCFLHFFLDSTGVSQFSIGITKDSGDLKLFFDTDSATYLVPVSLSVNTVYHTQHIIGVGTTTGQYGCWINNNDEESPDYFVSDIDTGSNDIYFSFSGIVTPADPITGHFFLDNIGASGIFRTPYYIPHRLTNLNGNIYDPTNPHLIYAEHINAFLDSLRP
jgi:hypothetical protein